MNLGQHNWSNPRLLQHTSGGARRASNINFLTQKNMPKPQQVTREELGRKDGLWGKQYDENGHFPFSQTFSQALILISSFIPPSPVITSPVITSPPLPPFPPLHPSLYFRSLLPEGLPHTQAWGTDSCQTFSKAVVCLEFLGGGLKEGGGDGYSGSPC